MNVEVQFCDYTYPALGMTDREVLKQVVGGYRMSNPDSDDFPCPDDVYSMMRECWNVKALDRPSFMKLQRFLGNY